LDALGDGPAVFRFERDGLEDQEIESALDKIGRLCHMPRLPTIVDDQQIIAQAGLLTDQPAGIREDDPGSILIVPEKTKAVPAGESGYRKLGGLSATLPLSD